MRRTISGPAGLEKISFETRNVCGAAGVEQLLDAVEELVAAAFGDVEQRDPGPAQGLRAGRERLGRAPALVEWAHVVHGTSFEIASEFIPRHGPNTAE